MKPALVTLLVVVTLACGGSSPATTASTPTTTRRTLEIASVRELGPVGAPTSVSARDGGAASVVGGRWLWTFGDTLFSPASADGTNLRSSTAALAELLSPLAVSEPLDSKGAPLPLLPFDAQEQAYNNSTGRPDQRVALWPTGVVTDGAAGWVLYLKLRVNPGVLNYEFIGTGLAHIDAGRTVALREPGLLFNVPEPLFGHAALIGDTVYLYGALQPQTIAQANAVARVPLAQIRTRAAYRFWDGTAWVDDSRRAVGVLNGIPGGISVSQNAYLGQYLAVHSETLTNRVLMHVADKPEGPWGPAIEAFTAQSAAPPAVCYAGIEHPELATNGGKTVIVSYYRPDAPFKGALRLAEVAFK
jgi:Domain of unknown function (DUF4185)